MDSLTSARIADLLKQLFQKAEAADRPLSEEFGSEGKDFSHEQVKKVLDDEAKDYKGMYRTLAGNYLNVSPEFGKFLYMCARSRKAKRIVEFGSSFGISTIHIACALRDGGGGQLIGTELEATKAAAARENLAAAGLADLVDIRVGDALETLKDGIGGDVDLVHLDGAFNLYLPVLKLLEPHLKAGALVNDSRLPAPSESTAAQAKRPGLIESVVQKLFTRQARVDSIEEFNPKFRLITLCGDSLKNAAWTPGDKVQIQLGGWVQRTYTPLDWVPEEGRTRILVYLHADGPGTCWARGVRSGDTCHLFGPRSSINLTRLRRPAIFFGDETTFGLARALRATYAGEGGVEFLFELSTPSESLQALESLGLSNVHPCVRRDNDAHVPELEMRMLGLLNSRRPAQFVLSGRSTAIQRLRQVLRQRGCTTSQFHTRAYWAPGKKGLD